MRMPSTTYYAWRAGALRSILRTSAGPTDHLVEVGCGYGFNLFTLATDPSFRRLQGFDISDNALNAARAIADHFEVETTQFAKIDLTQPDDPAFEQIRDKVVFTHFCLEQLPNDIDSLLRRLVAAGPARVIHIESAFELLSRRRLLDLVNRAYVSSQDYQRTLVDVARRCEDEGLVQIERCERLPFSASIHNDAMLLVWSPVGTHSHG